MTAPVGATPEGEDSTRLVRYGSPADRADPHPLYAVWEITLACDLGCKHCGSRAGPARESELTTAQCLGVVDEMAAMGIREVTLIGGEAYLREDWDQIAAAITAKGMVCGITSGGRGFTAERVQRAVDAGIRSISLSIDGLERSHNAQRGSPDSWRSALEAAERIAATPIRLATNTQINALSLPELDALARMLGDIGSRAWQLQLTVPMGRGADRPSLMLQPWQLLELFPFLVWIKNERLNPAGIGMFPGNNVGYFGPYESALRYGGGKGAHWGGCGAGKWCIGLEADGKIKACPSLPSEDWTGGYLAQDALAEVVANAPELTRLKNRTREDLWGFCKTCYYADICKAGCTWTSECILGRPGNNPYCIHRALEHEQEGLREVLIHEEAAPGLPFDHGRFRLELEKAQPMTEGQIGGFPLAQVTSMDWRGGGLWTDAQIRQTLKRIARGPLVTIG